MPFGLKNAGATYQRAMNVIFRDHLRKTVECYVDDIAIKSRDKNDHLLLAQRPLAQYLDVYFDDNKPYLVMYLTILFKRISG